MTRRQRIAINRQNAQKSTGPKSIEGKARSSRNALKHGLRAEILTLPNENPAEVAARTESWVEHYEPETPAECALVEQAALASLRLHRCARFEQAMIAQQVRDAEENWDLGREAELARLQRLLRDDPADAARQLRRLGAGCRWLLGRWDELQSRLKADGRWVAKADCEEALRLLGVGCSQFRESPSGYAVLLYNVAAGPAPAEETLAWLRDPVRQPTAFRALVRDSLPDRADSRDELARIVADEIASLRAAAERLKAVEETDRAEARDRALLLDDAPAARLLLRYQATAQSAFHRAYKELEKLADQEIDDLGAAAPDEPNTAQEPALTVDPPKTSEPGEAAVAAPKKGADRGADVVLPAPTPWRGASDEFGGFDGVGNASRNGLPLLAAG